MWNCLLGNKFMRRSATVSLHLISRNALTGSMDASRVDGTNYRTAISRGFFDAFITSSRVTGDTFTATSKANGVNITLGTLVNFAMCSSELNITMAVISTLDLNTGATVKTRVWMAIIAWRDWFLSAAWSSVSCLANARWLLINRFANSTIEAITRSTHGLFAVDSFESFRAFT